MSATKILKKLKKTTSTVREAAEKARHHHAASVKALTRQQQIVREEAKKAGMRVNAYKEKFSNRASVKKLKELQKQNETIRNKQFKKGGAVRKK
jgi:1,6-anhydro-N-acetylmuramate kinase